MSCPRPLLRKISPLGSRPGRKIAKRMPADNSPAVRGASLAGNGLPTSRVSLETTSNLGTAQRARSPGGVCDVGPISESPAGRRWRPGCRGRSRARFGSAPEGEPGLERAPEAQEFEDGGRWAQSRSAAWESIRGIGWPVGIGSTRWVVGKLRQLGPFLECLGDRAELHPSQRGARRPRYRGQHGRKGRMHHHHGAHVGLETPGTA